MDIAGKSADANSQPFGENNREAHYNKQYAGVDQQTPHLISEY